MAKIALVYGDCVSKIIFMESIDTRFKLISINHIVDWGMRVFTNTFMGGGAGHPTKFQSSQNFFDNTRTPSDKQTLFWNPLSPPNDKIKHQNQ